MKPQPTHLCQPNRHQRVIAALGEIGPTPLEPLAAAANTSYVELGRFMAGLVDAGEVVDLGTARELGITHIAGRKRAVNPHAHIYALPGTPKPQPAAAESKRASSHGGSGVIAQRITIGRGSKWGAGLV